MKEEIILTDWDPDEWRDDLAKRRWLESGAKTLEEYKAYLFEKMRKSSEQRKLEKQAKKAG
jgi:hypothetical protein